MNGKPLATDSLFQAELNGTELVGTSCLPEKTAGSETPLPVSGGQFSFPEIYRKSDFRMSIFFSNMPSISLQVS